MSGKGPSKGTHGSDSNGGTAAKMNRNVKTMLIQRSPCITAFIDSDNLVSLRKLIGHVQATKNLVLILTHDVCTREWVAVEVVTCRLHCIHVLMTKVDGVAPPVVGSLKRIQEMFGGDSARPVEHCNPSLRGSRRGSRPM